MLHALVTPTEYFKAVIAGEIVADLKKDDRPYQKGDTVLLQEFDTAKRVYTGRELPLTLTNVKRNIPREGLKQGFVFLSFTIGEVKQNELPAGYGEVAAEPEAKDGGDGPNIKDETTVV